MGGYGGVPHYSNILKYVSFADMRDEVVNEATIAACAVYPLWSKASYPQTAVPCLLGKLRRGSIKVSTPYVWTCMRLDMKYDFKWVSSDFICFFM